MEKGPDAFRTISEVADDLSLPQHVLRFWETRFAQIRPMKRGGGRRYYRPEDVDLLRGIRHLLYEEGYTIHGVQRILREHGARHVQSVGRSVEQLKREAALTEGGEPAPAPSGFFDLFPRLGLARPEGPPDLPRIVDVPMPHGGGISEDGVIARAPGSYAAPTEFAAGDPGLSGDQVQVLRGALRELQECQRLLDAARGDEG